MIKVILTGALGRMCRAVADEIEKDGGLRLAGAVEAPGHKNLGNLLHGVKVGSNLQDIIDKGDIVVDFSCPEASLSHMAEASAAGKPFITGTTGFSDGQLAEAEEVANNIPVLISPNMSAGVNLLFKITEDVTRALPDFDVEIVEIHHNRKKDSPSGTAAKIAEIVRSVRKDSAIVYGREGFVGERPKKEIGMHSLRGGDVAGEHRIIFAGEGERFELVHKAHSRKPLARGTIKAIHFIHRLGPGLYTMDDMLGFGR
ncbi:MAG: 4-hydroxy-tetrahydrodipicolinate reductase [Candidatus Krumholzibacteriota bacterium]|nr:4-hydroxy-tetrahydrodipicolinate reductase [Candidatus Krumholzibacteriota bacterium]